MNLRTKNICVFLIIMFLLTEALRPFCVISGKEPNAELSSQYKHLRFLSLNFDIDEEAGKAMAAVIVAYAEEIDQAFVEMHFEKCVDGVWVPFFSWIDSSAFSLADWEHSVSVSAGYRYRVRVYVSFVGDGTVLERVDFVSKILSY